MVFVLAVALAQDPVEQAVRKFHAAFDAASLDEKIALVRDLAHHRHAAVLDAFVPHLLTGHVTLRIAVARELGGFGGVDRTAKKLVAAYAHPANQDSRSRGVRITILRSLGELRAAEAADLVNARIADSDEWVAKAAIDAAGRIRHRSSVAPLLKEYRRLEGRTGRETLGADPLEGRTPSLSLNPTDVVRNFTRTEEVQQPPAPKERHELLVPPVVASLESITRQTCRSVDEWEKWWERNRSRFLAAR